LKVLAIGDIVGSPGRKAVLTLIPVLVKDEGIDFVVANGENAAGGSGITPDLVEELLAGGVDVITSGDHIWKKKEVYEIIDKEHRLLRPANFPPGVPGIGYDIVAARNGSKVAVINLLGRVFMSSYECPFRTAKTILGQITGQTRIIIVDFHAEATSEKIALGWYLDGKVSLIFGTHTHVQTADERILPKGTAYITDVGMVGPYDSVLGRRYEQIIERFVTMMPRRFEMASENVQLHGVLVEIDENTGRARNIKRIQKKL
jgi:metallophosphoesterase (TIGR00282 family)